MIGVIGARGVIGSRLVRRLREMGRDVVCTSRSMEDGDAVGLDLAEPETWRNLPRELTAVVVCAGESDLRVCRQRPAQTRAVNVDAVVAFARHVAQQGVFPILLSTSYVFDGTRKDFSPDDTMAPACEYGRQKADMEKGLRRGNVSCAVVRLTKVFGKANTLLTAWRERLQRGEPVMAASDARLSPLRSEIVADALARLALGCHQGLWHLSAMDDVSWADIARRLAVRCGAPESLVGECFLRDIDPEVEFVPAHGTLKMEWPLPLSPQKSAIAIEEQFKNICPTL